MCPKLMDGLRFSLQLFISHSHWRLITIKDEKQAHLRGGVVRWECAGASTASPPSAWRPSTGPTSTPSTPGPRRCVAVDIRSQWTISLRLSSLRSHFRLLLIFVKWGSTKQVNIFTNLNYSSFHFCNVFLLWSSYPPIPQNFLKFESFQNTCDTQHLTPRIPNSSSPLLLSSPPRPSQKPSKNGRSH